MVDLHHVQPNVRRVVLVLDAHRRRQFLDVVAYIEWRHYQIDPDMYKINLDRLAAMKRLLEDDDGGNRKTLSVAYNDLSFLELIVDAADTYSHRHQEPAVDGVNEQEITDLKQWLIQSERWFRIPTEEME